MRIKSGRTPSGNRYIATKNSKGDKSTEVFSGTNRTTTKHTEKGGKSTRTTTKRGVTPAGRTYQTSRTTIDPPKAYKALEKPEVQKSTRVTGKSVKQTKETQGGGKVYKVTQRLDGGGRTKIKKGFTTK